MKKSLKFIAPCLILTFTLTVTGCLSRTFSNQYSNQPLHVEMDARLQAMIEIGEKISGSATETNFLGFFVISTPENFACNVIYEKNELFWPNLKFHPYEGFFWEMGPFERLKAAAAYEAIHNYEAELIIAPRYEIQYEKHVFFSTATVTVTGYKGKIKDFKNVVKKFKNSDKNEDMELIPAVNLEK